MATGNFVVSNTSVAIMFNIVDFYVSFDIVLVTCYMQVYCAMFEYVEYITFQSDTIEPEKLSQCISVIGV